MEENPAQLNEHYDAALRAIRAGAADALRKLLREQPALARWRKPPDAQGNQNTLLHEVCGMGLIRWAANAPELAGLLLEAGAEVDAGERPAGGETPLHHAASVNNLPVAEVLLKAGADPERKGRHDGRLDTALGYALFYLRVGGLPPYPEDVIACLRLHGAKVKLPFAAALDLHEQVTQSLQHEKPDERTLGEALVFACHYGLTEMSVRLVRAGAPLNTCVPFFHECPGPLHQAVHQGQSVPLVMALLDMGADPQLKDQRYQATPLEWARHLRRPEMEKILSQHHP